MLDQALLWETAENYLPTSQPYFKWAAHKHLARIRRNTSQSDQTANSCLLIRKLGVKQECSNSFRKLDVLRKLHIPLPYQR